MKIENIDVDKAVDDVKRLLKSEQNLPPALKTAIEVILLLVCILLNRITLNSKNSSKPPSDDQNRPKTSRKKTGKPTGGQPGHVGARLKKVDNPDRIEVIKIDRAALPVGNYRSIGFKSRQVFDIDISRMVTEYQAQILEDDNGKQFIAPFPSGVNQDAQYGNNLKAHAVYMSQHQIIPYKRVAEYFNDQLHIPISEGSLYNFNRQAYELLEKFDDISREHLTNSAFAHADETGININGKLHWLHSVSNNDWTYYLPHKKRGTEAMNDAVILPHFNGILCHDHWKPYYSYTFTHALCNAHHIRELTRASEQDQQTWAHDMRVLLEEINVKVHEAGGVLNKTEAQKYRDKYKKLLEKAQIECPPPKPPPGKPRRGRIKRSKARNLLERLIEYEDDVLRFMENSIVPFTNNLAENDIRMTKVQQKISGCFRSLQGAKIFCRVRGYISTCRKQNISATKAMAMLFEGKLPEFVDR